MSLDLITHFLNIPSPTFHEETITTFCKSWMTEHCPNIQITESDNSLIFQTKSPNPKKAHIALVGHSDVVPEFKPAHIADGKLYGAGASDMKSAVALYMSFLSKLPNFESIDHQFSLIIYAREEGTALENNGLHDLILKFPTYFKSIDLAIVGEPTDNDIQVGCVGSLHCTVTIHGKACHSARPWQGINALYKAVPFIEHISKIEPKRNTIFGVDFFDIIQITESHSEKGRTSVPGYWNCNINYRFSPNHSSEEAKTYITDIIKRFSPSETDIHITDCVYPGKVIETPLFTKITKHLNCPISAKQAWTDVAQLTHIGIPAFNFGPGRTDQAHKSDEYIVIADINHYENILRTL